MRSPGAGVTDGREVLDMGAGTDRALRSPPPCCAALYSTDTFSFSPVRKPGQVTFVSQPLWGSVCSGAAGTPGREVCGVP